MDAFPWCFISVHNLVTGRLEEELAPVFQQYIWGEGVSQVEMISIGGRPSVLVDLPT